MGRRSDRRAARRATGSRRRGSATQYLGDYGPPPTGEHQAPNPYDDVLAATRPVRRRRGREHKVSAPAWLTAPERADRRAQAAWPQGRPAAGGGSGPRPAPRSPRSTPAGQQTPAGSAGGSRPLRRAVIVAAAVCVGLPLGIGLVVELFQGTGLPGSSNPAPRNTAPDADVAWEIAAGDVHTDDAQFADMQVPTGPASDLVSVVVADDVWIVMTGTEDERVLVGLDGTAGQERWRREFVDAQCGDQLLPEGSLACLAREGDGWQGVVLDPATGQDLRTWETGVRDPWGIHAGEAGVFVLDVSAPAVHDRLTLLDDQTGETLWVSDLLEVDLGEFLFSPIDRNGAEHVAVRRPRWDDLEATVLLRSGSIAAYVHPTDGVLALHSCYPMALVGERLGCSGGGTTMIAADGRPAWSSPPMELARTGYRGQEVWANVADATLWEVEWNGGAVGRRLSSVDEPFVATGSPELPFLISGDEALRIGAEYEEVLWSAPVADASLITTVLLVQDVAVLTGLTSVGLDPQTGEQQWERYTPGTLSVVDDRLVSLSSSRVRVFDLP